MQPLTAKTDMQHKDISDKELRAMIRHGMVAWGGNKRLKIYGRLKCASGKRMKKEKRVFFATAGQAMADGYRPCGHCMRDEYKTWKDGIV